MTECFDCSGQQNSKKTNKCGDTTLPTTGTHNTITTNDRNQTCPIDASITIDQTLCCCCNTDRLIEPTGDSTVIGGCNNLLTKFPEITISRTDEDERYDMDARYTDRTDPIIIDDNKFHLCCTHCGNYYDISSICDNIDKNCKDKELKMIFKELTEKVEFAERMNWLYISKRPRSSPRRKSSLPNHIEVKKRFMDICDKTLSDEVRYALRMPTFDSYEWEDEHVLYFMQSMFIETGLTEKYDIPLTVLREWLYEVYKHYNLVPFHNFRHCFCVAQMMYSIVYHTNLLARLGDLLVLILLVSCICHDLDHPGLNNIYQINARTELALRYNDISPLENHHCSIAFRLLEHPDCNIFKNFSKDAFKEIREGIIRCILATDMARHNEILVQFQEIRNTFDYLDQSHLNLLCMVLIKVADISNEARPLDIAEPWLDRLLQEFFAQSSAEKSEGLPVTPFMDPDKISKPSSQVRFIGLVLLPLFEALGELMPELSDLIIAPVRYALDYYKRLNDAQTRSRKSLGEMDGSIDGLPHSHSGISVRSRQSIPSQKSASRTSVNELGCISAELHDLPEDEESGGSDSETATEVEVAERASKFKVDTEGNKRIKYATRKSSREKRPSLISEMQTTSGQRFGSYGNIHNHHTNRFHFCANRAISLDQYSSNTRRLSDDLQHSTSDKTMLYFRERRSLDSEVKCPLKSCSTNTAKELIGTTNKLKLKLSTTDSLKKVSPIEPTICNQAPFKDLGASVITAGPVQIDAPQTAAPISKSFMSSLRQLTEKFSFGFGRATKRSPDTDIGPETVTSKNDNNDKQQSKTGFLCSLSNAYLSHDLIKKKKSCVSGSTGPYDCRTRTHSLDVPMRTRHSSSTTGGASDSRKSSQNGENHLSEDNNSNHTLGYSKCDPDCDSAGTYI